MLFKVTHTQTYTQEKAAVLGYKSAQRKLTTQRIHKHMFELSTGMLHIFCSVTLYIQSVSFTTYQQQILNMLGLFGLLLKSIWVQHLEWWGHIDM